MSKDIQPGHSKNVSFEVFRYQLVIDQAFQSDAFQHQYHNADELKHAKNKIFQSIISENNFSFNSPKSEITSQLVHQSGDMFYFKVNVRRDRKIPKKDFTEALIDTYPSMLVVVNNHPDVQKIAVQSNLDAFKKTNIVANFIQETVQKHIKSYNIAFAVEPTFEAQQFWNLVRQYPKRVTQVTFSLISPNNPSLTKDLQLDLKTLHGDTNTQKTTLELNAEKDSYLVLNEESELVNSIVDYAAKGGGDIKMKVAGVSRKFHTAQSVKDFNMEEQLLKTNDWDAINAAFKNILI
ncbi:MAG: hypothetical protein EOO07_25810 [Chitinophagaceae bacterium]|nr:MAG: hypothetical protein EOO07_25810 [Chitinophagaceae bacterium]